MVHIFQNVIWIGYLSRPYSWYISTENLNSFVHLNECSGTLSCGPGGTYHRLRRNSEIASGYLAAINSITSPRLPHRRHRRQGSRFGSKLMISWLVVSTPLKNISQLGLLFPIYGKKHIPNVPNHQPARDVSLDCSSVVPSGRLIPPNPWTTEKRDWCNNNGMLTGWWFYHLEKY
jgi:hypothetical protein